MERNVEMGAWNVVYDMKHDKRGNNPREQNHNGRVGQSVCMCVQEAQ
jgi:hypothetical protein